MLRNPALFAGKPPLNVDRVFNTTLYTGDGVSNTRSHQNGLNNVNTPSLRWFKDRTRRLDYELYDNVRPNRSDYALGTNRHDTQGSQYRNSSGLTNGFTVQGNLNIADDRYVCWNFLKSRRFFDIQTYVGNGVAGRRLPHSLGTVPGMIIIKAYDVDYNEQTWPVWHRSLTSRSGTMYLDETTEEFRSAESIWGDGSHNATSISLGGSNKGSNVGGVAYLVMIFAHDPSANGIVQCGSYVGNGAQIGPSVNLGWEPQWLLQKPIDLGIEWHIYDNRRATTNPRSSALFPNSNAVEDNSDGSAGARLVDFTRTGFQPKSGHAFVNNVNTRYIYMAIRKGVA